MVDDRQGFMHAESISAALPHLPPCIVQGLSPHFPFPSPPDDVINPNLALAKFSLTPFSFFAIGDIMRSIYASTKTSTLHCRPRRNELLREVARANRQQHVFFLLLYVEAKKGGRGNTDLFEEGKSNLVQGKSTGCVFPRLFFSLFPPSFPSCSISPFSQTQGMGIERIDW